MRYLVLIYGNERPEVPGVSEWETIMKEYGAFGRRQGRPA